MRDAFEQEHEADWTTEFYIMAAAQWILWNGQNLFKHFLYTGPSTSDDERL